MKSRIYKITTTLLLDFVILVILYSLSILGLLLDLVNALGMDEWFIVILIPLTITGIAYLLNLKFKFIGNRALLKTQLLFFGLFIGFAYWLLSNLSFGF